MLSRKRLLEKLYQPFVQRLFVGTAVDTVAFVCEAQHVVSNAYAVERRAHVGDMLRRYVRVLVPLHDEQATANVIDEVDGRRSGRVVS